MRKHVRFMVVSLMLVGLASSTVFAGGHDKGKAGMKDKFFKKVMLIYRNQDKLNISEEQMNKIKDIKIALKKEKIRKEADIDLVKIDVWTEMQKDEVDQAAVNKLIDRKYALKSELAKKTAASCVALKGILGADQQAAVKKMMMEKPAGYDADKRQGCGCKGKK